MRRGSIGAIVVGLLAACLGVPVAVGASPLSPRPVLASAGDATVEGAAMTYCVEAVAKPGAEDDEVECGDVSAPTRPPRERLVLRPRGRVALRFQDNPAIHDEVAVVRVSVVRIDARGAAPLVALKARRASATSNDWHLRLPANLRRANALEVHARFGGGSSGGSSDYLVGLRAVR